MYKTASTCRKTARKILADIAKQTIPPALVTYFEGAEKDMCGSLLLISQCKLSKRCLSYSLPITLVCINGAFFSSDIFCSIMTLLSSSVLFNRLQSINQFWFIFETPEASGPVIYFSRFY